MENLAHDAGRLIGLKKVLGVGRAVENDELLGLRSFIVLGLDTWETRAVAASIAAGDKEERRAFELVGWLVWCCAEHYDAVDFVDWLVVKATDPIWAVVKGDFRPRGGISTIVEARWPRPQS